MDAMVQAVRSQHFRQGRTLDPEQRNPRQQQETLHAMGLLFKATSLPISAAASGLLTWASLKTRPLPRGQVSKTCADG
jgi:hypothetical protein